MSTPNNNPKGIVLILLGMAFFSIQDSLIKFINEDTSLYEIYFGRTLIAFILLLIYLKVSSQKLTLKTHYPLLTITRVICFFFGFSFFYISLTFMTLAMANALFFSSPFFVSILAVIFLKEKVGIRRWLGYSSRFFRCVYSFGS
jgi:drug/metabolite transporter (DMT)-like permease